MKPGLPCTFDPEHLDVPDCVQAGKAGLVSANYLPQSNFAVLTLHPCMHAKTAGCMSIVKAESSLVGLRRRMTGPTVF